MQIINKKTAEEINKTGELYLIDLGVIKKNQKATTVLQIKGEDIKGLTTQSDCSCTEGSPNIIDKNTIEVDLTYKNTHIVNPFNKNVYLNFTENGEAKSATINIKGQVTL